MKIKKYYLDNPKWDGFCLESDDCWFWHTSNWIEYTLEYFGQGSEQFSFYIEDSNQDILAICPLIKYKNRFTFGGFFDPNPALRNNLSPKLSKKLLGDIFLEIDNIAINNGIKECTMNISTLTKNRLKKFAFNYLMKYDFENISLNTQIIDLGKDERTLWGEIKKSHRYEIKRGNKLFKFKIDLPYSKDDTKFKEFKNLHLFAAGRMTRSEKTWEKQLQWKNGGYAVIINAYVDDTPVGGIYTILYKDGSYYTNSANHPDYEHYPISHSIQWEIIKWLKRNRFRYYELGIQHFSDQPYNHPNKKDIDISLFKRHFGGYTITHYRGKKRYLQNKQSHNN